MELTNEFRVAVPLAEAWVVLNDVERIAPCLPGAQLQEIEGDQYRGIVKVKVGPITAQYKGVATFLEQDLEGHRVVLKAEGRDTRGQGNASATITATLVADGDDATVVTVVTDLTVTGKVAQFGRGVLAEVSGKLMGQFVDNLHRDVLSGSAAAASAADAPTADSGDTGGGASAPADPAPAAPASPHPGPSPAGAAAAPTTSSATAVADAPGASSTAGANGSEPTAEGPGTPATVRHIAHPEPEPVDLMAAAGGSVARRVAPLIGALVVAGLVWRLAFRRRRHS